MCIHLRIYLEGSDRQLLRQFKRNTFQFCFYCHILFLLMPPVDLWPGGRGQRPPNFFEILGFSEILMFRRKMFGLLLLVKVSNFIGKSLNLVPPILQVPHHLWSFHLFL